MNWCSMHTPMDRTHSLTHLHQHSYIHVVRSICPYDFEQVNIDEPKSVCVTASDIRMHHVLIILTLNFIRSNILIVKGKKRIIFRIR